MRRARIRRDLLLTLGIRNMDVASAPQNLAPVGPQSTALKRYLSGHPIIAFLLMGLSFLMVGLISLNLIYLFHANIEFVLENGLMGLRDGGLLQFLQLLISGYLGMALYALFKACEKVVVDRMLERKSVAVTEAPEGTSEPR
jgi:hypothetical protein